MELIIVLKSCSVWWVDSGLELDRVEEKTRKEKTWLTRQHPIKNPVATR
jgi:hypothetical protein